MSESVRPKYGCHNRKPFKQTLEVKSGIAPSGAYQLADIPFTMSMECQYKLDQLGKNDSRCDGCEWRGAA